MKCPSSTAACFPENFSQTLRYRHRIIIQIRNFFDTRGYVAVDTPVRVKSPGVDPYIDAVNAGAGYYLAPSPELHMKRLLCLDIDRLYQITHAFRENEQGQHHNCEFMMLEWYRKGTDYAGIMEETEELILYITKEESLPISSFRFPFEKVAVDELYVKCADWRPSADWNEDRYFHDWVEKIDPYLKTKEGLFICDFPEPLAALSKPKEDNGKLCQRFELFIKGIEIANAYTELTDYEEHGRRFKNAREKRRQMGKDPYHIDEEFMRMISGGLPECGGIALGIDRLIMAMLAIDHIDHVQTFPFSRL